MAAQTAAEGEKMAKERRRGNRELRKPKAAKPAVAAPSPLAMKTPALAASPLKRKR